MCTLKGPNRKEKWPNNKNNKIKYKKITIYINNMSVIRVSALPNFH